MPNYSIVYEADADGLKKVLQRDRTAHFPTFHEAEDYLSNICYTLSPASSVEEYSAGWADGGFSIYRMYRFAGREYVAQLNLPNDNTGDLYEVAFG